MTKRRKRAQRRTLHIDWCPSVAAMFDLAARLGWTAPDRAKVVMGRHQSTWSAIFRDDNGQPVRSVVRLKHQADGSAEVVSDEISVRFIATAAMLREVA